MSCRKKTIIRLSIVIIISLIIVGWHIVSKEMFFKGILEGNYNVVEKAITLGADVNQERFSYPWCNMFETNDTPLTLACDRGNEEIVRLLIDAGANVNQHESWGSDCPLLAALRYDKENRYNLAWLLIEHGADINVAADQEVLSPLWNSVKIFPTDPSATRQMGYELFQYLMQNLENQMSQEELNLLYKYATDQRNESVIDYLLEHNLVVE